MNSNQGYSGSQSVNSFGGGSYMGGSPGDWQQQEQQQQQQQPYIMNQRQPPSTPGYSAYPQNTPANTPAFSTPHQQQSQGYPAGTGSITRFATPQQQPGTPLYPQSSPYNFTPPPQPNLGGASGGSNMSYSERAAMLQKQQGGYGQQQQPQAAVGYPQQQQQLQQQNQYSQQPSQVQYGQQQPQQQQPRQNAAGMSFAQRSQAMLQNQPQQSNVYRPQQQGMSNSYQYQGQPSIASPQRPPHPSTPSTPQQQPQMGGIPQQQHQRPGMPTPQQQQQQPGMQNPQQQQPGMQSPQQRQQQQQPNMAGSFAQRSQMAHSMAGGSVAGSVMGQSTMGQSQMMPPQQQQQQLQPPRPNMMVDPPEVVAQQTRLLTDATRKVQEHAYYMKQAMERHDLPTVLDRAASMVGELGEHAHSHHHHHAHPPAPGASGSTTALSPKNYYELHLRALEELPTLEDYLLNLAQGTTAPSPPQPGMNTMGMPPQNMMQQNQYNMGMGMPPQNMMQQNQNQPTIKYTMKELYDCVQYCPNVLSRLYLQICAASALIRSGEVGARFVLRDMIEAVKCVQNPVRGLFLRHYLLQAFRDKMPDAPIPLDQVGGPIRASANNDSAGTPPVVTADVNNTEKGTVKDSYEFILSNFIEMNKLWVRIQHLPGDGKSKEIRRRREKDRNELRILVGTNLVRLSAIETITSSIYGQVILPTVLEHIVICGDPLAQAYLIDCIVQVFPDEYHIETMPILLGVCPKLRDKVNIRTILQSLMDRLANYLADEELLDEADSNQVKRSLANDSFRMFDECVQNVYNARGPKLQAKEVIRLQTALLSFTMKCYKGNMEQMTLCLNHCVVALQQASANQALINDVNMGQQQTPQGARRAPLDSVATQELEKLLSIPLDELALGVLKMDYYADLIGFLPWKNRKQVALTMLEAVSKAGSSPGSVKEIEELFSVIAPVLRDENDAAPGMAQSNQSAMDRTANLMAGLGVSPAPQHQYSQGGSFQDVDAAESEKDGALVSKLIHLLYHEDTDVMYEMFAVARTHLNAGRRQSITPYEALVFASLKLSKRILDEEAAKPLEPKERRETEENTSGEGEPEEKPNLAGDEESNGGTQADLTNSGASDECKPSDNSASEDALAAEDSKPAAKSLKSVSCRKVFVFIQEIISRLAKANAEKGIKLYLEAALAADKFNSRPGQGSFGPITYELVAQSFALYEENSGDSRLQGRCIVAMVGTLLACRSLTTEDYESLTMKTAQYSAKMLKKTEQCEMVAMCSYLFYNVSEDGTVIYSKPQRGLECLQRALKLADACTNSNPANVQLFVDLLEHYLYFFERKHPLVTGNYITGLVALIKEHTNNLGPFGGQDSSAVGGAKAHFLEIVRHIKRMKDKPEKSEHFASIDVSIVSA